MNTRKYTDAERIIRKKIADKNWCLRKRENKRKVKLKYLEDNKELIEAQKAARIQVRKDQHKAWFRKNSERMSNLRLRRIFGITKEDYKKMFESQEGRCKICKTHQSELTVTLNVDHCHKTGKIRGLLCMNCNLLLSDAKDDDKILNSAIEYLSNLVYL